LGRKASADAAAPAITENNPTIEASEIAVRTEPKWVSADYDNCRKISDADPVWYNDVSGEIGVSSGSIKILGGNPSGAQVTGTCAVTLSSPLGVYVCGYRDMYTRDGGRTTFVTGRGLGYDASCYKPK
jgi:hypothetical protein